MLKILITGCLLGGILSGCDSAVEHAQAAPSSSVGSAVPAAVKSFEEPGPGRPLDLELSRDMLDQLVTDDGIEVDSDRLLASVNQLELRQRKQEPRISLNGRLFYDAKQENYIDAIDGGKIDIQIRFND